MTTPIYTPSPSYAYRNRRKYDDLTIDEKVDEALSILESILEAFPEGPVEHRKVHETWIRAKNAEADFWVQLKLDIAKKGIWGLLSVIVGLILVGISTKSGVWFR